MRPGTVESGFIGIAVVADAADAADSRRALKDGIEIVALTSQTSIENRYSAKRVRDGKTESIALRERFGPHPEEEVVEEAPVVETPKPAPRLPKIPTVRARRLRN